MWTLTLHEYYTILHKRVVSGLREMSVVWCSVSVV